MSSEQMAQDDFKRAYRKGFWRKVASWLRGESNELLPYQAVRERIPLKGQHYAGHQQVKIDQIVGSLGRYRDFDRAFLPRQARTRGRWESIDSAHYEDVLLPPVELYKMGEVYFVKDGNHRVSVARRWGQEYIDAYVTELDVPVPLTPDLDMEDLDLKGEYAKFLELTNMPDVRPGGQIELTIPGEYDCLLEHINVHRWYMGEQRGSEVPYQEAVASWYDNVYSPLVNVVNEHELRESFPGRTEADLYLWIIEYEWFLREAYREEYSFEQASRQFKDRFSQSEIRKLENILKKAVWVDNLVLEQERDEFLARTNIGDLRPEAQIVLTAPGKYYKLVEHIDIHRWYLGETEGQEVPFEQAVVSWYDKVYLPLVGLIRELNILNEFPGRTDADLYLWIIEQQNSFKKIFGEDVPLEVAVEKFTDTQLGEPLRNMEKGNKKPGGKR